MARSPSRTRFHRRRVPPISGAFGRTPAILIWNWEQWPPHYALGNPGGTSKLPDHVRHGHQIRRSRLGALAHRRRIFLIGDVLHPGRVVAVLRFLHRDVNHAGGRSAAMPMLFARRNKDHIAALDLAYRLA